MPTSGEPKGFDLLCRLNCDKRYIHVAVKVQQKHTYLENSRTQEFRIWGKRARATLSGKLSG